MHLNDIEFGTPFRTFHRSGAVTTIGDFPAVPEELDWHDFTSQLLGTEWEPVGGLSNQHGYTGPLMHASEFIGDELDAWLKHQGDVFCVVVVEDAAEVDYADRAGETFAESEPVGWMILRSTRPLTDRR